MGTGSDRSADSPEWAAKYQSAEACAFCKKEAALQSSHILPAFVFKWLKDTGGTGYLRSAKMPNRRAQDGQKMPMLCRDCEQLFSKYEREFAGKVFQPYIADDGLRVAYGDWLSRFCATISWRVLALMVREGHLAQLDPARQEASKLALEHWEQFITGEQPTPGRYEQHLLPFSGVSSSTVSKMPTNMNRYLRRCVEIDLPQGTDSGMAMTYAKIGPMMIFGYIAPPADKWLGTRVAVNFGRLEPGKFVLPVSLMDYFFFRAGKYGSAHAAISQTQRRKIEADVTKNIDRFKSSDQFKAIMEDLEMFGEEAIIDRDFD
ncbi:hypothetical protein ABIB57_004870 [Devosia sp. UYZn731]|uniref:hypothetical protein n=1 Tax=Devosia sp. UYZn731 TaxID=3156345 RepID=UPI00339669F3